MLLEAMLRTATGAKAKSQAPLKAPERTPAPPGRTPDTSNLRPSVTCCNAQGETTSGLVRCPSRASVVKRTPGRGLLQLLAADTLWMTAEILGLAGQVAKRSRLFLRGGADSRRIAGATEIPDGYELLVLPLREGKYRMDGQRMLPKEPVRNEDLPNLRADWLRQQSKLGASTVQELIG